MDALDSFRLEDRTAILTGPCTSYHQAIAGKLTQLGCDIAFIHHDIDRLRRFAEQLMDQREVHEKFGRAVAIQASVGDGKQTQDAITRAAESFGGLDVYIDGAFLPVHRAFRDGPPQKNAPARELPLLDLDEAIDLNLRGPLLLTQGILRFLENRKRGRIIYLMHDLARMGLAGQGILAATRMGLMSFAKTMARECQDSSITVNCVSMGLTEDLLLGMHPSPAASPAVAVKPQSGSLAEWQLQLAQSFPQAQLMDSEKIANLVAFLASPLSGGITGQTISVSQGLSLL